MGSTQQKWVKENQGSSTLQSGTDWAGSVTHPQTDIFIGGVDSKFTRIPLPGKHYDVHFGVQGTAGVMSGGVGSDGLNLGIDVNPSVGGGVYGEVIPRGESGAVTVSYGFKNLLSVHGVRTEEGGAGFGGSIGASIPWSPVPVNVTIPVPLDKEIISR
jgi:hypothetical protein